MNDSSLAILDESSLIALLNENVNIFITALIMKAGVLSEHLMQLQGDPSLSGLSGSRMPSLLGQLEQQIIPLA